MAQANHPTDKVRRLQRRLFLAAKRSPQRRFHALYDRIARRDVLARAWAQVRQNRGAAGVDGETIAEAEAFGVDRLLTELREQLETHRYRPRPLRRVFIPKAEGRSQRPLGIPGVRDRVLQAAAKLVLEPIFEASFRPSSFGFRPRRSAHQAVEAVRRAINSDRHWVVEVDIRSFYDSVDHEFLLRLVARRCSDRRVLKLIRQWLRAGVLEEGTVQPTAAGVPQGGVISPLLANVYLHALDALHFTYTHVRGYHPLLAVAAGTGDVLHSRLRGGRSTSGRGAAGFLAETIARVRAAGATGPLVVRADSGFYEAAVVRTCRRADVRFSITVRLQAGLRGRIEAIPEDAWTPIPYWQEGGADVAEFAYTPLAHDHKDAQEVRLIVRRVRPTPGSQLALITPYSFHAFITDRAGDTLALERDHRRHAEVENTIRDLKYGVGFDHLPSGRFGASAAWLALQVMAHDLARWTSRVGLKEQLIATKTLRSRFLALPGRLARSARRLRLHLPHRWPWADRFATALATLRAISLPHTA